MMPPNVSLGSNTAKVLLARHAPNGLTAVTVICLFMAGVAIWRSSAASRPKRIATGIYQPDGYVTRVEKLIDIHKSHALIFDPDGGKEKLRLIDSRLLDEDRQWLPASRLPDDLAAANKELAEYDPRDPDPNPGLLLWVEGGKPVIDADPARIRLPKLELDRGKPVRTAAAQAYIFAGERMRLLLVPALERAGEQRVPLWGPQAQTASAPDSQFFLTVNSQASRFSALLRWEETDEHAHLEVRADPALRLWVNGELARGDTVLNPGSLIGFEREGNRSAFVFLPATGRAERAAVAVLGNAAGGPLSFRAMQGAPHGCYDALERQRSICTTPEVREAELVPTLQPALQEALQTALERKMSDLNSRLGRQAGHDVRGEPASVLLMDALTGDVLAMASWPSPATPPPTGLSPKSLRAFTASQERNGNFSRHVIGSAGKPFWVAAALECFPELAGLEIGPKQTVAGKVQTTLGYSFGQPTYEHGKWPAGLGANRRMDRRWFFAHSTNAWFMDLMVLCLARHPLDFSGPATNSAEARNNLATVRLGGQPLPGTPRLDDDYPVRGTLAPFERSAVATQLGKAFGVHLTRPSPGMDLSLVQPVWDLASETDRLKLQSYEIAPQAPHLDFGGVQTFRDLSSHLLGGGSARWSNAKLAEAIARLGTGKLVEARLVRLAGKPAEPAPEWTELSTRTRDLMRESLQGATNSASGVDFGSDTTAAPIGALLREWNGQPPRAKRPRKSNSPPASPATPAIPAANHLVFRCYSKTGTAYATEADIKNKINSGNYVFCLTLESSDGKIQRAISGAIYVHRRGLSTESAIPLAQTLFPILKTLYFDASPPP